ncbi:MAG: monovalent cation/H+ antiporter complex subunit F [Acidimicrobiales bacterium]
MNTVTAVAFAALAVSALLCVLRLLRPSNLADRVVALDLLVLVVIMGVAVNITRTGDGIFADLLLVASLLAFVATVVTARFIEDRGA